MAAPADPSAQPGDERRASQGVERQTLSRAQRLTASASFRAAYERGLCRRGVLMNLWLREGEGAALRLGVVASRRVGGAVQRARAKRLLREVYRRNRHRFAGPWDVILSARSDILRAKWPAIERELLRLAGRAGILHRTDAGQPDNGRERPSRA